jgi:hypothetical protein
MVLDDRVILCDSETFLSKNSDCFPNLADGEAEKSFPTSAPRSGKSEIGSSR